MNILFDARFITQRRSGVGRVSEMLLRTFLDSCRDLNVHVLHRPPMDKSLTGHFPIPVQTPFDSHPWGDIHRNTFIRNLIIERHIDLYFSPAFYCIQMAKKIPQVVLIHDLAVFDQPRTIPPMFRMYLRQMIRSTVRNAAWVTTPSEFIRDRLLNRFPAAAGRVRALHLGVSPVFRSYDDERAESIRRHYCLPSHFLLSVATVEPRKNMLRLLDAYSIYCCRTAEPMPLVVIGEDGYRSAEVHARAEKADLSTLVRFLGYVPDHELALLYGMAHCLIYPSLYEGFGLPVVEAMAAGCPVITSNTASLPEVAGGAAMFIDPTDINDLALAMRSITENAELRRQLSMTGRKRVEDMTWEKTAAGYEEVFYEAVDRIKGKE